MRSGITKKKRPITKTSKQTIDEVYDLRGVNLIASSRTVPKNESPFAINCRMQSRTENDHRPAMSTRKGCVEYTRPINAFDAMHGNFDESHADIPVDKVNWIATPFQINDYNIKAVASKLTAMIKRGDGSAGQVLIELREDKNGKPEKVIAQSSFPLSRITSTYTKVSAKFVDAPFLKPNTQYWAVIYVQDEGTGTYHVKGISGGTTGLKSNTSGGTWATGPAFAYDLEVAEEGVIKGWTRRRPQNGDNRIIVAFNNGVYAIPETFVEEGIGVGAPIGENQPSDATRYRFEQIDDKTIWCNGKGPAMWYDGTRTTAISGMAGTPTHVIAHKNRLFWVKKEDPNRVDFSGLYEFESYRSVDFFYVPNPKSADHIVGWVVFQDNLVVFTTKTKYILSGNDISTFTMKEAVGTKGGVSQELIYADRNYIYFMADDNQIYRFNGVSDQLISDRVQPELDKIQNLDTATMSVFNNQLRIHYAKKPSTLVDRVLMYDMVFQQWFMDTGHPVAASMPARIGDRTELLEISSRAGWVFLGERGYSDMGKAIDFKYWTPYKIYTSGSAKDRIKRFRPVLRASQSRYNMLVGRDIDEQNKPAMRNYLVSSDGATWGGGETWGGGKTWGSVSLVQKAAPMSGRGKSTQFRFEKKGVETPIFLIGYIAVIKSGRAR